jgi:D-aminoacyl-tRNA deacylase
MKAVIQRVLKASVKVGDNIVGSIQNGLCVLVGISHDDTDADLEYIVRKILNIRLFSDTDETRWEKSVMDKDYEVLCISQFTLFSTLKGNKPQFRQAMKSDTSLDVYMKVLSELGRLYKPDKIQRGQFGEKMEVNIVNDGPVTIILDSKKKQEEK